MHHFFPDDFICACKGETVKTSRHVKNSERKTKRKLHFSAQRGSGAEENTGEQRQKWQVRRARTGFSWRRGWPQSSVENTGIEQFQSWMFLRNSFKWSKVILLLQNLINSIAHENFYHECCMGTLNIKDSWEPALAMWRQKVQLMGCYGTRPRMEPWGRQDSAEGKNLEKDRRVPRIRGGQTPKGTREREFELIVCKSRMTEWPQLPFR